MGRLVLVAFLALAVGFAAGWLVFDQPSDELALGGKQPVATGTPDTGGMPQVKKAQDALAQPRNPEAQPDASQTVQPDQVTNTGSLDVDVIVRNALAGANIAPVEKGTGTITGTVKLKDGSPLEGVEIIATPGSARYEALHDTDFVEEDDLSTFLRNKLIEEARKRQVIQRARTDASGDFVLGGLSETASYSIRPVLKGYSFEGRINYPKNGRGLSDLAAGADLNYTASATVPVTFRLVNAKPDGRAELRIENQTAHSVTGIPLPPEGATLDVEVGELIISARDSTQSLISEEQPLSLVPGAEPRLVELTLQEMGGIRLIITKESENDGRTHVNIRYQPDGSSEVINRSRVSSMVAVFRKDSPRQAVLDFRTPDRSYQIGESFRYFVVHKGVLHTLAAATWGNELQDIHVTLPAPDPGSQITLRTTDPQGNPLNLSQIDYIQRFEDGTKTENTLRRSGPSLGVYTLELDDVQELPSPGLQAKEHALELRSSLGTETFVFERGRDRELSFQFKEPATIRLVIEGCTQDHQNGQFSLNWSQGESRWGTSDLKSVPGDRPDVLILEQKAILTGTYSVSVGFRRTPDFHAVYSSFHKETRELVAGVNAFVLTAPPIVDLTIYDPDAKEGDKIVLGNYHEARADANGCFTWKGLPAGTHFVQKRYGTKKNKTIEIRSTETIEWRDK